MAFILGNQIVLHDSETGELESLKINGTDVLTHDGSTITLKNVDISDSIEGTINSDNVSEGSTNKFFTTARENAVNTAWAAADTAQTTSINAAWAAADTADAISWAAADATTLSSAQSYTDNAVTTGTGSLDTDDITEAGNLYYTDARADARAQLKIDALVDSAPGTLNTLNELAAALGDDANYAATTTAAIGANTTGITNLSVATTNAIAALNHDTLSGFVANEHIDWSAAGVGTIHASNYVDNNTTYVSADFTHDDLTGFVANEHIDWSADQGGTVIHTSNYTNTGNTTYTAGNGLNLNTTEFELSGSYTGSFTATGDITAYSDKRLKRNIETISNPIDLVNCLRGVNFEKDGRYSTGVIAQEVEEFFPEVVHTDAEGMKSVAYGNITGLLIEAIKEQQKTIDSLQEQIDKLNKI